MTTIATKQTVKAALAAQFPGQTFKVVTTTPRPATFSIIYGVVRITWTHGVSEAAVKEVMEQQFTLPENVHWQFDRCYTKTYLQSFLAHQYERTQQVTTILGKEDEAFLYCEDLPSLNHYLNGLLAAETIA